MGHVDLVGLTTSLTLRSDTFTLDSKNSLRISALLAQHIALDERVQHNCQILSVALTIDNALVVNSVDFGEGTKFETKVLCGVCKNVSNQCLLEEGVQVAGLFKALAMSSMFSTTVLIPFPLPST